MLEEKLNIKNMIYEIRGKQVSINNVGNKIFSINKPEDKFVKQSLLDIIGSCYDN